MKRKAAKVARATMMSAHGPGPVVYFGAFTVGSAVAAGFQEGDRVRIVPQARYRELLAAERRAKKLKFTVDREAERRAETMRLYSCACGKCSLHEPRCPVIRAVGAAK